MAALIQDVRSVLKRLAKLEAGRVATRSPLDVMCGTFDAFADHVQVRIDAAMLDARDMLGVVAALRR